LIKIRQRARSFDRRKKQVEETLAKDSRLFPFGVIWEPMNRVDLSIFHLKNDIFKETLILAIAIAKTKTYN